MVTPPRKTVPEGETSHVPVIAESIDGTIAGWNAAAAALYGYRYDEIAGQPLSVLYPDDIPSSRSAAVDRVLLGEEVTGLEAVQRTKDGRRFSIVYTLRPHQDEQGRLVGLCKVIHEIRSSAEEHVRDWEHAAWFTGIVESAVDGIIAINGDGHIEFVNAAACAMFGYEPEEIIGQNVSVLMPAPHRDAHDQYIQRYIETGERTIIGIGREAEGQRKDGTVFPVHLGISEVFVGERRMFTGIVKDLSRPKAFERALSESEQRLRTMADALPVLIAYVDRGGRYRFNNAAYEEWFGERAESFSGRHLADILGDDSYAAIKPYVERVLAGEACSFERSMRHRTSGMRYVHVEYVPHQPGDRVEGFFSLIQDITERKRSEEQLRALNERYGAILSTVPTLLVEVDSERRMVWLNDAALRFYGDDALHREPRDYFVGEQNTYEKVAPLFSGKADTIQVESWQRRKDGEARLLAWSCRPLTDESGSVRGALSAALDITERVRAQEEETRLLAELTERNKKLACLFGVSEELSARTINRALLARIAKLIQAACRDPERTRVRIRVDHQTATSGGVPDLACSGVAAVEAGDRRRGEIEVIYIRTDPDGRRNAIVRDDQTLIASVARNLGEAIELRDAEVQLVQASKLASIGELAAGVSHEINNPVNGIINCADILIRNSQPDSVDRQFVELIRSEADRIAAIVRNLLTFSRQDSEHRVPARLESVLEAVLSLCRKRIEASRIHLDVSIAPDLPDVPCQPEKLQQVILNLIINAIHALDERFSGDHPAKKLRISVRRVEDGRGEVHAVITVEDHGAGIDSSYMERIFDPFFTTKGRDKGTGLGLSISHGIIKEHGGEIRVESQQNAFTRFIVWLPVNGLAGLSSSGRASRTDAVE